MLMEEPTPPGVGYFPRTPSAQATTTPTWCSSRNSSDRKVEDCAFHLSLSRSETLSNTRAQSYQFESEGDSREGRYAAERRAPDASRRADAVGPRRRSTGRGLYGSRPGRDSSGRPGRARPQAQRQSRSTAGASAADRGRGRRRQQDLPMLQGRPAPDRRGSEREAG